MLPVGAVTLVLGDVEDSARLWAERPDEMHDAILGLHEVLDEEVARHDGAPLEQGEGDSFVVGFSSPSAAAAFALAVSGALAGGFIRVRIGIHTGEVRLRDGDNYAGTTINRAARVRDAGHGGQILLSQATTELVVDHLPADAVLDDLGSHRLPGLDRPEHIWHLRRRDGRLVHPPLRSVGPHPHNLPIQLTRFIGRERELETLEKLPAWARLITLVGTGGAGKTRLALELASRSVEHFAGGTWFVPLAAVTDPHMVGPTVAGAMRSVVQPRETALETVVRRIGSIPTLIVLDNCERLVGPVSGFTAALLDACPTLTVVATSREPLEVPGEVRFRVPSLALPDPGAPPDLACAASYEAVALFIDRAVSARPDFSADDDSAPVIVDICHRVDGIPLAIELAAARCRLLTPGQILEGLSDRFRLLADGAGTATPRHRTLRASMDWSYDLLEEGERLLLDRLSVFSGGFTLSSVEEVCRGDAIDSADVLDLLTALVDRSLVVVAGGRDEMRYRLLETVRAYALDRLGDAGEVRKWRDAHRSYFAGLAASAFGELVDGRSASTTRGRQSVTKWRHRLRDEADNLRTAIEWSRERRDAAAVMTSISDLLPLWLEPAHVAEGGRATALALDEREGVPEEVLARALLTRALVSSRGVSGATTTMAAAQEAAGLAAGVGDARTAARAKAVLGFHATGVERTLGEELLQESLTLLEEVDDEWIRPYALSGLALNRRFTGRLREARELLTAAVEATTTTAFVGTAGGPLYWLAYLDLLQGRWRDAIARAQVAFEDHLAAGEVTAAAGSRWVVAMARAVGGDVEGALVDCDWITDYVEASPEPARSITRGMVEYARLSACLTSGDHERGREALIRMRAGRGWGDAAFACGGSAMVAIGSGDLATAEEELRGIDACPPQWSEALANQFGLWLRARLARLRGDPRGAEELAHRALERALEMDAWGPWGGVPVCVEALATAAADLQRHEEAGRLIGAAAKMRVELSIPPSPPEDREIAVALACIGAALGDDTREALSAEGAAMGIDELLAYVRRGRGRRGRAAAGWASLTPAEERVVALLSEGLTNGEIAARLFTSTRTVGTHLSHVYTKLGMKSRTQVAAAWLARQSKAAR